MKALASRLYHYASVACAVILLATVTCGGTALAESRINLENQVDLTIPVTYPSRTTWVTSERLQAIGVDRFAKYNSTLNRDMNELLDSMHRGRPSAWIAHRLRRSHSRMTLWGQDKRTVQEVFAEFARLGPCPGTGFTTDYSYVTLPVAVRSIERNPPDLLFQDGFRFALYGDGRAYPHGDPHTPSPEFSVELIYSPEGAVEFYRFDLKPCPRPQVESQHTRR